MIITNNPYTRQLQDYHREENRDKIRELEQKSREFTQKQIKALHKDFSQIEQRVEDVREVATISNQYKQIRELHRDCKEYKFKKFVKYTDDITKKRLKREEI